ncbi:hypothetical protein R6L23_01590 [Streptomyces sp. SR27]|uniref:hypothetical protein n=1 Tax=Streptomyces sp. SR27 TaxID=3076630 RepID=UPI00295C0B1E|nr:hypothetical protein [Streptomyces sp. SR27]MDV9186928.1 hypothetical protein [Streptomyces sp. SR27]
MAAPTPGPSVWNLLADERMPGLRRLPAKQRVLYLVVAGMVVVGGLLFAYYANYVLDRTTSTDRLRSDKVAEKAVDREQPAFVSTITPHDYEQDMPENIIVLLDRPLTTTEQATLTSLRGDNAVVWAFMKPLGGRIVEYTPPLAKPLLEGGRAEPRGKAQSFNLNLNSDRGAGLTINGMSAAKDSCSVPTAQTVVDLPPAGSESRLGLLWDLTGGKAATPHGPYVLDEGDAQGTLFFRYNAIDLGNGQSNMALRIQPVVSDQTCTWHIDATYTDTSGAHTQRIPSGLDTITTEAVPRNPVQRFIHVPGSGWGCVGKVNQKGCPATGFLPEVTPSAGS